MTANTSTEQLHQLLELVLTELDRKSIPFAYMQEIDRKGKAFIEQAARRAPAVPVPQVTNEMIEAANEAYCPFGDMELAIQAALAAAPKPPEAAPVQLPEPFTTLVRKKSWSPNCYEAAPLSNTKDYGRQWADERINVYTEQQVRELLAAHGIQEQST